MNIILFALSTILTFLSGWLILKPLHSQHKQSALLLFKLSSSFPLGLSISSICFFAALAVAGQLTHFALLIQAVLCAAIAFLNRSNRVELEVIEPAQAPPEALRSQEATPKTSENISWLEKFLYALIAIFAITSLSTYAVQTFIHPHGGWDAVMEWNQHAKFLYRGGADWHRGLSGEIVWNNPDYPMLLPTVIGQLWQLIDFDTTAIPQLVALSFAVCSAISLYSSLLLTSKKGNALLALLTLLITPNFCAQAVTQLADIPVCCYFLLCSIFLCLADVSPKSSYLLLLSGFAIGSSIWTKNDGFIFLAALILARLLISLFPLRSELLKKTGMEALLGVFGAMPALFVAIYWRYVYAPPNGFVTGSNSEHLFDPARHFEVAKTFLLEIIYFGEWQLAMSFLFAIYKMLLGRPLNAGERFFANTILVAMSLSLLAYYIIYVRFPTQTTFTIYITGSRLLMQLYPTFLFWLFFTTLDPLALDYRISSPGQNKELKTNG